MLYGSVWFSVLPHTLGVAVLLADRLSIPSSVAPGRERGAEKEERRRRREWKLDSLGFTASVYQWALQQVISNTLL